MSFNITAAAAAGHYSSPEQAYANTDFSSLGWLEKQWAAWYIFIGNPIIATGLMSFLLHEVCIGSTRPNAFSDTYCPRRLCTLAGAFLGLS